VAVRINDPSYLLQAFEPKVFAVLGLLREWDAVPRLHETLRTPARSQQLRRRGTSRVRGLSMHCYGAAADIICDKHLWGCRKQHCDFYQLLGRAAKQVGVWWGGDMFPVNRWTKKRFIDLPHIQAVPFKLQNKFRACDDYEKFVMETLND
jgi:hypothetical protein